MLDSIYHKTLKVLKMAFWRKTSSFTQLYIGRHYVMLLNLLTTSGVSILLNGVISLLAVTSCDNVIYLHFVFIVLRISSLIFHRSQPQNIELGR